VKRDAVGMTPDGISAEDWDRVHELALEVVNRSGEGEEAASESASLRLREVLDELQQRYGPLLSLLATRADYMERVEEQEYWLLAAYDQAVKLSDARNLVFIASSLATFHLETVPDPSKGAEWLSRLNQHLAVSPNAAEANEALRLQGILESLKKEPHNNRMQLTRSAHRHPRRGPRS
jgi:hypothetical protein